MVLATTLRAAGRKPRAIAIGPAPNRLCSTAAIVNLLVPKRRVIGGLVKSPNRLRWLAHGEATNRLRGLGHGVADLPYQPLWIDGSLMQIWDRSRFGIVGTF